MYMCEHYNKKKTYFRYFSGFLLVLKIRKTAVNEAKSDKSKYSDRVAMIKVHRMDS